MMDLNGSLSKLAKYICPHNNLNIQDAYKSAEMGSRDYLSKSKLSSFQSIIGDSHILNCNECGAYFPKTASMALRMPKRNTFQFKLFTSDFLRIIYGQC